MIRIIRKSFTSEPENRPDHRGPIEDLDHQLGEWLTQLEAGGATVVSLQSSQPERQCNGGYHPDYSWSQDHRVAIRIPGVRPYRDL